jgi:hypothetical protein
MFGMERYRKLNLDPTQTKNHQNPIQKAMEQYASEQDDHISEEKLATGK